MTELIYSGALSFGAAILIAGLGISTWRIGHSVPVAVMNSLLVLANVGFGVMNVMTH